jgi:hypothetical protein
MSEDDITLRDFFSYSDDEWSSGAQRSNIEARSQVVSLKEKIASEHKQLQWDFLSNLIVEKIGDLLDMDLKDILIGAWQKCDEIDECLSKSYGPAADETMAVALAEHTIDSKHDPKLDILLNGKRIGAIVFHIQLSLDLQGFVLKIQGGEIKEIQAGTCRGRGVFKCEDLVLLEKKTEVIQLPGRIRLDN